MKLCYMLDIDKYEEKFPCSKWNNLYERLYQMIFKQRRVKGPFLIKDGSFKVVGSVFLVDFNNFISNRNLRLINNYFDNEEGFICLPRDFNVKYFSMCNIPYIHDEDIYFIAFFLKLKKMVKDAQKIQVGVCLDKNTNYEYIKMICEYFPLVIFFVNNPYIGENIASNILKDTGSSIYVSKSISSMKKCDYIFDLSKEMLSDKINYIECENYISLYKKNEYIDCKKIINDVKIIPSGFNIQNIDIDYFELSFVKGLILLENNINDKKDILNINLEEFLHKKSLKMRFFNGFKLLT